ncbi:VOC family protein [Rossellomorea vietnamensis]|uniref:VOC family protein n=1 Tax=Rossellomorea vietnamensis TaxID=218284 RepID=A0A5D4NUI8_9BACI|nr:VOC family protein [Rossellomorea vietnamensis]TYS17995.1 VOC family protein [Rossellomorea vietnamensis]
MNEKLVRVGATYLPVQNPASSAQWYSVNLGAEISYQDSDKAILNLANQSFFLVKAGGNQSAGFFDKNGEEHFSLTFEVDGLSALEELHHKFKQQKIKTGDIEDRGHAGRNFVFWDMDGNMFDVWSELSPDFKKRYTID